MGLAWVLPATGPHTLSSAVGLKVDFDMALLVVASGRYLPIILASGLLDKPVQVPWWNGFTLRLSTHQGAAQAARSWRDSLPWKSRLVVFNLEAGCAYGRLAAWDLEVTQDAPVTAGVVLDLNRIRSFTWRPELD